METTLTGLSDLLDVDAVMARYALRDRRAARRVMDSAGAFRIAGRLLVSADALAVYERELATQRKAQTRVHQVQDRPKGRQQGTGHAATLGAEWWKDPDESTRQGRPGTGDAREAA